MTATITLNDDDQSTVQRMLTYLYTLDYDDSDACPAVAGDESPNTDNPFPDLYPEPDDETISHCKNMNNIRVYALADKYNIPALKELAKVKFKTCMTAHGVEITRFTEIVDSIFNSTHETDRGLRDIIISGAANTSTPEQMLGEGPLASAIRDHSTFGLGLLREVVKKHISEQEKQKQDVRTKMTKLRLAVGSLYLDSQGIYLPVEQDSKEDFDRCYQTAYSFQDKLRKFKDTLKSED